MIAVKGGSAAGKLHPGHPFLQEQYMKTWETEDQLDRDERFVSARQNANARQIGGTHYVDMAVQPWEVMEAVLSRPEFIGYLRGCIIKYGMRQGKKEGSDDAGKLKHYIEKYKEVVGNYCVDF